MDTCIVLLDFGADVNAVSKLGNKVFRYLILNNNNNNGNDSDNDNNFMALYCTLIFSQFSM